MELDLMELDVVEIAPLASSRSPNLLKRKEAILREEIDAEEDEDSADMMIIDKKLDSKNKGKTVKNIYNGYFDHQAEVPYSRSFLGPDGVYTIGTSSSVEYSKSFTPNALHSINLDSHGSDNYQDADRYIDFYTNDAVDVDEYDILQAQFDKVDIPPGVEADLPWLPDLDRIKSKAPIDSSSNYRSPMKSGHGFPLHGIDPFPSIWSSKATPFSMNTGVKPPGEKLSAPQFFPQAVHGENESVALKPSGSALKNRLPSQSLQLLKSKLNSNSSSSSQSQLQSMKPPHGFEPPSQERYSPTYIKRKDGSNMGYSNFLSQMGMLNHQHEADLKEKVGSHMSFSNFPSQMGVMNHPPGVDVFSWSQASHKYKKGSFIPSFPPYYPGIHNPFDDLPFSPKKDANNYWDQEFAWNQKTIAEAGDSSTPCDSESSNGNDRNLDILMKFRLFKQFDTVDDHSDHYYAHQGYSMKQASAAWAKQIQKEWKILEKDLPDTIFVRVYESRMDLLRAVIKGAEGTPYHDGLFFFDIFFPSGYPSVPPNVKYHSGGLRLNPNLYNCGKVCLSLLNTWAGNRNENWIPGTSTMLQVLVSIQGLILNTKPYFNEPGYARKDGTLHGERESLKYNEDTLILSLRTMSFTMRRPPKHFEDLVKGHFCERARDVMLACKAYMNGAQIGSLVKGQVQDAEEGSQSYNFHSFKAQLAQYAPVLARDLTNIGAKDCEKLLPPPPILANTPSNPVSGLQLK